MPIRLMLLFILAAPLAGIIQVENGAYAPSAVRFGEPNGATAAFAVYAAFVLLGAWIVTRGGLFRSIPAQAGGFVTREESHNFQSLALPICLVMLALTLFAFGGLSVLSGNVGKGEFRASLGGVGALAYLTLKWFAPCMFGFACALHVMAGRPRTGCAKLFAIGVLTFMIGLSWGFKTSGLFVLMPGFIILLWRARIRGFVLPGIFAAASIYAAFSLFDTLEGTVYESVLQFLVARLTVFVGDVSWLVWGMFASGEDLPNYWSTPLVAIGDQLYSLLTGITRDHMEEWISVHYGAMLTYLTGYPIEGIEGGHSVTGTPFSEGIIALGLLGIPVFGLLAGFLTGFVFNRILAAFRFGRPLALTLWANYAVWCLFAWLNGGDIVQLFHVSVLTGVVAVRLLLSTMMSAIRLRQLALAST